MKDDAVEELKDKPTPKDARPSSSSPAVGPADIGVPDNIGDKVSPEDAGRLGRSIVWGRVVVAVILALTPLGSVWLSMRQSAPAPVVTVAPPPAAAPPAPATVVPLSVTTAVDRAETQLQEHSTQLVDLTERVRRLEKQIRSHQATQQQQTKKATP